jgi:hypothetical protein
MPPQRLAWISGPSGTPRHTAGADRGGDAVVGQGPADQEASFSNASTSSTCFGVPISS